MKSLKKFNNFINEDHLPGHEGETHEVEHHEHQYYMFFENLQTIKRCIDDLLSLDETEIDEILASGHDWASDHIATAKEDIEQVHNFMVNNTTHEDQMGQEMGYDSEDFDEVDYDDMDDMDEPMSDDMYLDDEEYDNMPDDTEYED
jgi:hypothetical protein